MSTATLSPPPTRPPPRAREPAASGVGGPTLAPKPRVLCVEPEESGRDTLSAQLGRRYEVLTAADAAEAFRLLRQMSGIYVLLCAPTLPDLDGVQLLCRAREMLPAARRVLLGEPASAQDWPRLLNEARASQVLPRPWTVEELLPVVDAAVEAGQREAVEHDLAQRTLRGSVAALADMLALASPLAAGRAKRVRAKAVALGRALKLEDTWPLETAATFSELGSVALPALLLEKALNGRALQLEEERTLDRSRVTTDQLLRRIPQLELVRGIVALVQRGRLPEGLLLPPTDDAYARRLAGILHVAIDHEALEASGNKPTLAAEMLRGRRTDYHGEVLDALGVLFERSERLGQVYELPPSALEVGMTLADDLRLSTGAMLVPRGYQVTPALVARLVNLSDSAVRGKARVYRRTL